MRALAAATERLRRAGEPWRLLWCAGAGVVATGPQAARRRAGHPRRLPDRLAPLAARRTRSRARSSSPRRPAASTPAPSDPPFTEETEPRPISPYGEAKLAAEVRRAPSPRGSGVPVLVGRIANLYGPGQDLAQGPGADLRSCAGRTWRGGPSSIYVSLDTARDYIYVDDAARLAVAARPSGPRRAAPGTVHVKILASQTGTTVAAILGELRRITKHRPRVVLGASPAGPVPGPRPEVPLGGVAGPRRAGHHRPADRDGGDDALGADRAGRALARPVSWSRGRPGSA